jgi:hypothetical protein
MATRTITSLVDDVDQSEAAETLSFGIEGITYEIDLSQNNTAKLRDDLAPWVAKARRTGGRRSSRSTGRANKAQAAGVREWLRQHGHEVSTRGRIPANLQELYKSSH